MTSSKGTRVAPRFKHRNQPDSDCIFQPEKFPGQFWDADAGLAYNWNRWYSPEIGRYVEVDPTSIFGSLLEPEYAYARGNPLLVIDKNGARSYTVVGMDGQDQPMHPAAKAKVESAISGAINALIACKGQCRCINFDKAIAKLRTADVIWVQNSMSGNACASTQLGGSTITLRDLSFAGNCGSLSQVLAHEAGHLAGQGSEKALAEMEKKCFK